MIRLDAFYKSAEVADFLSISIRSATKLFDAGEIPGWRVAPRYKDRRVPARSLAAWLARHPDYLGMLRAGLVRPRRVDPAEVAEIVREADRLAALPPSDRPDHDGLTTEKESFTF